MTNVGTYFQKHPSTKFVVKNIAPNGKRIRIFQYPIINGATRDLLAIPGISEADIRHSLLKGELLIKLQYNEITIVDSDIDLLQFNEEQKQFLQESGITTGLELDALSGGSLTADDHKTLRQLIHLADGMAGPMEGFASGAYRETLPVGDPFPTSIIWWESSAKIEKIIEKTVVYDGSQRPTTITAKVYNEGGNLIATISDAITYNGSSHFETTRTRTVS